MRCTFEEPGLSAFEPDSSMPMTALTLTVLPTTTDRISTLSVAPVLAAYGSRQRSFCQAGWRRLVCVQRSNASGGLAEVARIGGDDAAPHLSARVVSVCLV